MPKLQEKMTSLRRGTCCREPDHIKLVTGIRAIFASPSINVTLTRGVGQGGLIGDFDAWEMSGKLIRPAALLLGTGRCRNLLLAGGIICRYRHQPFNRCSGSSCNYRRPCEGRLTPEPFTRKTATGLFFFKRS